MHKLQAKRTACQYIGSIGYSVPPTHTYGNAMSHGSHQCTHVT